MTVSDKRAAREEKITALLDSLPESEIRDDEYFMNVALSLANLGAAEGEVPVGCVIVRNGEIIAADYNGRETFRDATYHAETAAISAACKKLGGWRLIGCTLYVTLEPCPMCAGAIWCARVPRVVIGTADQRSGALGGLIDLNSYPLNHKSEIVFGVLEDDCRTAMQNFFRERRKKTDKTGEKNELC